MIFRGVQEAVSQAKVDRIFASDWETCKLQEGSDVIGQSRHVVGASSMWYETKLDFVESHD
jgi:hypothetical protein